MSEKEIKRETYLKRLNRGIDTTVVLLCLCYALFMVVLIIVDVVTDVRAIDIPAEPAETVQTIVTEATKPAKKPIMHSIEIVDPMTADVLPEPEPVEEFVDTCEPAKELVFYDIPMDEKLQEHIIKICDSYYIEPSIVFAMIERESRFKADVVGDNGRSYGLMQIQPRWHKERMAKLGVTDLLDPYQNVLVGIDYLAELFSMNEDVEWVLMAYNGGMSYANRLTGNGTVSAYAAGVLDAAREMRNEVL